MPPKAGASIVKFLEENGAVRKGGKPRVFRDPQGFDKPIPGYGHPDRDAWEAARLARIRDVFGEGALQLVPPSELTANHIVNERMWPHGKQYRTIYQNGSDPGPLVLARNDTGGYRVLDGNGRLSLLPEFDLDNHVAYVVGEKGPQSTAELAAKAAKKPGRNSKKVAGLAALGSLFQSETEPGAKGSWTDTARDLVGSVVEPAATFLTGAVAKPAGDIWATMRLLAGDSPGQALKAGDDYTNRFTYVPESKGGEAGMEGLAKPLEVAAAPFTALEYGADKLAEHGYGNLAGILGAGLGVAGVVDPTHGVGKAAKGAKAAGKAAKTAKVLARETAAEELAAKAARTASEVRPPGLDPAKLVAAYDKKGGFTYSPAEGRLLGPKDGGYAVGMYPHLSQVVDGNLTPDAIAAFQARVAETLGQSPDNMVGAWRNNDGKAVLDVVRAPKSLDEATALGKARGEQALYDLKEGRSLDLDYTDHLTPEQSARSWPFEGKPTASDVQKPGGLWDLFNRSSREEAVDAGLGGIHLSQKKDGTFVGMDPAIKDIPGVLDMRARRLALTELGAPHSGWYIDQGSMPPEMFPGTGFRGGALFRSNPLFPDAKEVAVHSPKAPPVTNAVLQTSVEHGARQPGHSPASTLAALDRGEKVPTSVKPGMPAQTQKHLRVSTGEPVAMGPKEGRFWENMEGLPEQGIGPTVKESLTEPEAIAAAQRQMESGAPGRPVEGKGSTIDRHEITTTNADPITPEKMQDPNFRLGERGVGDAEYAVLQYENLLIDEAMRQKALADPNYLKSIGWPHFPNGEPYPMRPAEGQAGRWKPEKTVKERPADFARDPQAAMAMPDPGGRFDEAFANMAGTVDIPEGFDWRLKLRNELPGYDRLYTQRGMRQWPELTPDSPTRAHPVLTTVGQMVNTMPDSGVKPWSERLVLNRELGRSLYQGQGDTAVGRFTHGPNTYEASIPLSQAGEGTGVRAWLDRLSPQEKNELGAHVWHPTAELPPESPAAANTRASLQRGGVRGLESDWVKAGGAGFLGLTAALGLPSLASAAEPAPMKLDDVSMEQLDRLTAKPQHAPAPPPEKKPGLFDRLKSWVTAGSDQKSEAAVPVAEEAAKGIAPSVDNAVSRRKKMLDDATRE